VVLVVQHSKAGTVGLLLNRPTGMIMRPGKGGLRYAIIGAPEGMQEAFADNRCEQCACRGCCCGCEPMNHDRLLQGLFMAPV
jgi:hypothetical protein